MKHVFGLLLMVCLTAGLSAADFRVAMGLDLMGEALSSESALLIGMKNQVGVSLSGQAIKTTNNIGYGFGVDYQFPRKNQSMPMGWSSSLVSSSFVPFYGLLSYSFPEYRGFSPEFIGQLGYSVPIYDYQDIEEDDYYQNKYETDGGLYTGMGIGMQYKDIDIQLLYRVNRSIITSKEYDDGELDEISHDNHDTRQWNLSLGYRIRNQNRK